MSEQLDLRDRIQANDFKKAVAQILPTHLTPERFVRIAIAATTRVPKLNECDPNTVLQCLITLSQFGLEPDGRNAHLIPFWNSKRNCFECQLIIDYKGLATLAKRSGQVSYVHADKVCEHDVFEYNKGVVVKHEVDFKKDRGKPYAYYAMVRFKDGTEQADAMTKPEVDKIRARSRAANNGPWVTDYDEMGKKTVFRRLSKWLELSPEFREALEVDADALEELRFENAIPIERPKFEKLSSGSERIAPDTQNATAGVEVGIPISAEASTGTNSAGEPASKKPKKKLKPRVAPAAAPTERELGPNEKQMLARLNVGNRTKEHLVVVARMFEALKPEQGWDDIGEEGFADLLHPDNWGLLQPELEKL